MLGILVCMSCTFYAYGKDDNDIFELIRQYQQSRQDSIREINDNVYAKYRFNVERRNFTMWLIPTLYVMAKDEREYIRESYSHVSFADAHHYDINNQVLSGTIRRHRKAIPTLLDFLTPNIYDIALYDDHILSPFNKLNRRFYRFKQKTVNDSITRLEFRPKLYNTQLVNGYALIESATGRIIRTMLNGEYDMVSFRTEIQQGTEGGRSLMPSRCSTTATFNFLGNRIATFFDALYNSPTELPDSMIQEDNRALMDSIRPIPLSETDKGIYQAYDNRKRREKEISDSLDRDTTQQRTNVLKKIFWDTIGYDLVTPIAAESKSAEFRLSPIINPLYIRYSQSRGFSYKINLRSRYTFSPHRYLDFDPTFGYNFKQRRFYFDAPLRMTYNPKRNGYAVIEYGNGNLISNTSVMNAINHMHRDTINFDGMDLDLFDDTYVRAFNNIMLFDWLDIESGLVFHQRQSVNPEKMREYGVPAVYKSFAPSFGIRLSPWHTGPVLSLDWERSFKNIFQSNINYERFELDATMKYKILGIRYINLRFGCGFYTSKNENYFLDFAHFHDNNLPEGFEDEWSGDFELLNSRWYNESRYYVRGNASYDSPLLIGTCVPYLGKYIERERFYFSSAIVDHTRPYFEIGYSFTNRYISAGIFASFLNTDFQRIGFDFEFELFRRW